MTKTIVLAILGALASGCKREAPASTTPSKATADDHSHAREPSETPKKVGDACGTDTECATISIEGGRCCEDACVDCFGPGHETNACCQPASG